MVDSKQDELVVAQFGPRAAAYVESVTHRQGEDLKQLALMAAEWRQARVLDLGCGGGHATFAVAPHVKEVIAYDLSRDMLEAVAAEGQRRGFQNIVTRQGAAEELPFADGEFDVVMSRYSMHHWSDLGVGLREARRVLNLGGRAVFIDTVAPAKPALDTFLQAFELFRDPSHVRNYSETEFRAALAAAGFTVTAVTLRRVPIAFKAWIERMNTPAVQAEAIRAVQRQVSAETRRYFSVADDGSFELDAATFEARRV
jgi:SAM-dependent methyltransferase